MAILNVGYANILKNHSILYLPSCLIIEMITRLLSQVSMINISGNVHAIIPDLLILLRRLAANLSSTAVAYRESRIKFFIGDWKDDRLQARQLFFDLMERLGYLGERAGPAERELLVKAIEDMGRQWGVLDGIMEEKCREAEFASQCGACRYFRSKSRDSWQQIMANILLSLDGKAEYRDPRTILILLCYRRIRLQLLLEIANIEARQGRADRFSPDRILCISDEDLPITCANCALMTNSRHNADNLFRQRQGETPPRRLSLKKNAETRARAIRDRSHPPIALALGGGRR